MGIGPLLLRVISSFRKGSVRFLEAALRRSGTDLSSCLLGVCGTWT